MNILAIGSDARSETILRAGDIIRSVRVDFINARVIILEVPRAICGWRFRNLRSLQRSNARKIESGVFIWKQGFAITTVPARGFRLPAQTLNLNFGAQPDHYLAVNMNTFENIDANGTDKRESPYEIDVRSTANPRVFMGKRPASLRRRDRAVGGAACQYSTFTRGESKHCDVRLA